MSAVMSTVLAIDTASEAFALALAVDGEVVAVHVQQPGRDHAAQLIPSIEQLLAAHPAPLGAVAVVTGPGSYAGLRAGIASAQGLGLARAIPVMGVPTLAAVVRAAGLTDGHVAHPAGRGTFAVQAVTGGELTGALGMSPGLNLPAGPLAGELTSVVSHGREVSPGERVRAALEIALERLAAGDISGDVEADIEAIYLREPHITVSRRIQTAQIPGGQ